MSSLLLFWCILIRCNYLRRTGEFSPFKLFVAFYLLLGQLDLRLILSHFYRAKNSELATNIDEIKKSRYLPLTWRFLVDGAFLDLTGYFWATVLNVAVLLLLFKLRVSAAAKEASSIIGFGDLPFWRGVRLLEAARSCCVDYLPCLVLHAVFCD